MSLLVLRVLERIHGHLGWLAVAALLHPAIFLRNPKRRARLSVALATALVLAAGLLGGIVYPPYRDVVKQRLFLDAPRVGWLFERKEHLAVGALAFAVVGCVAHLTLSLVDDEALRPTMARTAHRAFVVAFALAFAVATLGVWVATYRSF